MIDVSTLTIDELRDLLAKVNKEMVKREKEERAQLMNNIKKAVFAYVERYGDITINTDDGEYYLNTCAVFDSINDEITIE